MSHAVFVRVHWGLSWLNLSLQLATANVPNSSLWNYWCQKCWSLSMRCNWAKRYSGLCSWLVEYVWFFCVCSFCLLSWMQWCSSRVGWRLLGDGEITVLALCHPLERKIGTPFDSRMYQRMLWSFWCAYDSSFLSLPVLHQRGSSSYHAASHTGITLICFWRVWFSWPEVVQQFLPQDKVFTHAKNCLLLC